jgi:hypothetical protein
VAIGSDDNTTGRWGRADVVDFGDSLALGFGRVWAGRYQNDGSGSPGGALEGVKSTTQRWANAIGGTAAHEAGHTYGLSHSTSLQAGEDSPVGRHVMPAGSDVNAEQRAGYRRHFSDESFSILASNVGLAVQTLHNWDLVNPNATDAKRYRLTFLTLQSAPVISWDYDDELSPWDDPTISAFGTQTLGGTTYNRFRITWSTGKPWLHGASGTVDPGDEFHVGAALSGVDFDEPNSVIVTNSELLDDDGDPLPLKPRLPGYDAGSVKLVNGILNWTLINFTRRPLWLDNVVVRELPRVMSLNQMVDDGQIRDPFEERFEPWPRGTQTLFTKPRRIRARGRMSLPIAAMRQPREVFQQGNPDNCDVGDSARGPDSAACGTGFNVSLFPSTMTFITADLIDRDAKVWAPRRKRFVRRNLRTRIYYQFAGIHPDLNRNKVDDVIDIATGASRDGNQDGVPDEAQR